MIKKVSVEQLEPGMYIHDLNCGWMSHPFLKNNFTIKSDKIIEKIIEYGVSDVYIDTDKGSDVQDAPTAEEVDGELEQEVTRAAQDVHPVEQKVPVSEELVRARELKREAKKTVQGIMEEVRLGKRIKTDQAEAVVDKMVESIFRNQDALISLGRIKQMDEYTYVHSMSVCVLMLAFGKQLGLNAQQLREAGVGAMLHDVGKMKVPLEILNSRKPLSDDEYMQMKKHVEYSHALLSETRGISELSIDLASQHHERVDGKGYPRGLRGEEISVFGKAAAIADVYDAMTSQRCYQQRHEPTEVLKKLYEWSGSYSSELVQQFVRCVGIYPVGTLVRLESGLLGIVLAHGKDSLLKPLVRVVYDTNRDRYVVTPYDLELSEKENEKVVGYESLDEWGIKPELYM
jgi:putative nucleotidyltransferase with HDIG domain